MKDIKDNKLSFKSSWHYSIAPIKLKEIIISSKEIIFREKNNIYKFAWSEVKVKMIIKKNVIPPSVLNRTYTKKILVIETSNKIFKIAVDIRSEFRDKNRLFKAINENVNIKVFEIIYPKEAVFKYRFIMTSYWILFFIFTQLNSDEELPIERFINNQSDLIKFLSAILFITFLATVTWSVFFIAEKIKDKSIIYKERINHLNYLKKIK